jgi:hypothetical protein
MARQTRRRVHQLDRDERRQVLHPDRLLDAGDATGHGVDRHGHETRHRLRQGRPSQEPELHRWLRGAMATNPFDDPHDMSPADLAPPQGRSGSASPPSWPPKKLRTPPTSTSPESNATTPPALVEAPIESMRNSANAAAVIRSTGVWYMACTRSSSKRRRGAGTDRVVGRPGDRGSGGLPNRSWRAERLGA